MEGNYKKWLNRINAKQDVLTKDNVGEFMDLELPTKLTPTSGDTVLARDSVTGKAVEIPIDQLTDNTSETTEDVTSTTTVGAINAGDIIQKGTTIQGFVEKLLNKIHYPTYTPHSFSLTNNAGNKSKEVGSSFNITLTFNFNRGEILGKLVNNVWLEDEKQADRLGAATSYILNGVNATPNNFVTMSVTVGPETNTLSGTVAYGDGAQPKDSKGDDFESRILAGESTQSTTFKGVYPFFYYKSTSPITPAIMQSAIANGQATKVIEDSTGTITVNFLPNGEYIAVAYPATSATKKKWYVTPLDNGDIKPGSILGNETTLPCNSPTGLWNGINFKIHVSAGVLTQYEAVQLKNS